jgi:cobalamin biosynthetic protein CobC
VVPKPSPQTAAESITDIDGSLLHGGDLAAARTLFPGAPEPFIDLSTGINPHSYPVPQFASDLLARLPEKATLDRLAAVAAAAYGAPTPRHVVAAPGTQILLPAIASLVARGRTAVLGPTYAEFIRAAALVGHRATEVADFASLGDVDLVMLANPNNPDGRVIECPDLVALADTLRRRPRPGGDGGLLVVDEAFMDVGPAAASLAGEVECGNVVVLRSFGKFFGLAGLRLGFALASPPMVARLAAWLGPWAVSGPALAIGATALADERWATAMRERLAAEAGRLDRLLAAAQLDVAGGTSLFRLVRTPAAADLFDHLGWAGIWVRPWPDFPGITKTAIARPRAMTTREGWAPVALRIAIPPNENAWQRLEASLRAYRRS